MLPQENKELIENYVDPYCYTVVLSTYDYKPRTFSYKELAITAAIEDIKRILELDEVTLYDETASDIYQSFRRSLHTEFFVYWDDENTEDEELKDVKITCRIFPVILNQ